MKRTRKERASLNLQATAFHEAGHAVVNVECGIRNKTVSIEPDLKKGLLGQAVRLADRRLRALANDDVSARSTSTLRAHIEDALIPILAGELAENRFRSAHGLRKNHLSSRGDRAKMVDALIRLSGDTREVELRYKLLHHRAALLVDDQWGQVEKVAKRLLQVQTMTGKEVDALLFTQHESLLDSQT